MPFFFFGGVSIICKYLSTRPTIQVRGSEDLHYAEFPLQNYLATGQQMASAASASKWLKKEGTA